MTHLNPQTTSRHQLRTEKAARNREAALAGVSSIVKRNTEADDVSAHLETENGVANVKDIPTTTEPYTNLPFVERPLFRAVHVQSDDLRRSLVVYRVDPTPRQIGQGREVLRPRQHRGLEPAHGARRRRPALHRPTADEPAHHRIAAQPVGVIDVFISCKARENRLPQKASEAVPSIPAGTRIADQSRFVCTLKVIHEISLQVSSIVKRNTEGG